MLEQLNIKKAELSSRIIQGKSQENAQDSVISSLENKLKETENTIAEYTLSIEHKNAAVADNKQKITDLNSAADKLTQQYHRCLLYTSPSPRDGLVSP